MILKPSNVSDAINDADWLLKSINQQILMWPITDYLPINQYKPRQWYSQHLKVELPVSSDLFFTCLLDDKS